MGMALFFVRKRILSWVAAVACSNRAGLSGDIQSGRSSLTAEGSMTLPETMWSPNSPAFSKRRTRKSSLPASLANCLSLMAALSPEGPRRQSASFLTCTFDHGPHLRLLCTHQLHRFPGPAAKGRFPFPRRLQVSVGVWSRDTGCMV